MQNRQRRGSSGGWIVKATCGGEDGLAVRLCYSDRPGHSCSVMVFLDEDATARVEPEDLDQIAGDGDAPGVGGSRPDGDPPPPMVWLELVEPAALASALAVWRTQPRWWALFPEHERRLQRALTLSRSPRCATLSVSCCRREPSA